MSSVAATHFAPAERLGPAAIKAEVDHLGSEPGLKRILDSIPMLVMLLNRQRQIILANSHVEALAQQLKREDFIGLRPGEFLACGRVETGPGGCGTGEGCHTCGALQAILAALEDETAVRECHILTASGVAYDLRAKATLFGWLGREYVVLALEDISAEKRRLLLERVFFHDVLNTAGTVSGIASFLAEHTEVPPQLSHDLVASAETLISEIKSQRLLLAAEKGDLQPQTTTMQTGEILGQVAQLYRHHPVSHTRCILIEGDDEPVCLDPAILERVLANMLKNALEATPPGGSVTIGAHSEPDRIVFWCRNAGEIPRTAALQIFQRSFSTKGYDRGVGTYSMKLLGERYLGGKVSFTTSAEGTCFELALPRSATAAVSPDAGPFRMSPRK